MRDFQSLLLTLVLGVSFCRVSAQNTFLIKQETDSEVNLSQFIRILPSLQGEETPPSFQDIIKIVDTRWVPYTKAILHKPNQVIWAKLTLRNELNHDFDGVLKLDNRYLRQAEVYLLDQKGNFTMKKVGNQFSAKNTHAWAMPTYPKIKMYLRANEQKTLYICFHQFDQKTSLIHLELQSKSGWNTFVQKRNLFQGVFQGMVLLTLLYNLYVFLLSRNRIYAYYLGYLCCIALYFFNFVGFSAEFIFPNYLRLFFDLYLLSTAFLQIFYLQFIRLYLNTQRIHDFWDKVLVGWMAVSLIELVLVEILLHTTDNFALVCGIHHQFILVEAISMMGVLFVWRLLKARMVNYLIVGTFWVCLGLAIGIFKDTYDGNAYFQVGSLMGILCFSLGLGHRTKLNEKERIEAREAVIKVQKESNEELEHRVQERTQQLRTTNEKLTKIHDNLQDSIRYAQRLQKGVLPLENQVKQLLPHSFVLFRPRDIVSGDFYWVEPISDHKVMVAVADCTGHGIPGAMMSMMGSTALTEIVLNRKINSPTEILIQLDKMIQVTLRQNETNLKDGMDISICLFDFENQCIDFAGAHHPLYYFYEGELKVYKGAYRSIGGNYYDTEFKSHQIPMQKGAKLYMFSDGFQDQFGGEEGRKFMIRRLKKLLLDIHQEPMELQKSKLEKTLDAWMSAGKTSQTDDILLFGLSL